MILALALALTAASAAAIEEPIKRPTRRLNTDLSLAAQQRGYTPLDSLSAAERATAGAAATRRGIVRRRRCPNATRDVVRHNAAGNDDDGAIERWHGREAHTA